MGDVGVGRDSSIVTDTRVSGKGVVGMFKVQSKRCATCIFNSNSPLDLAELLSEVADDHGGFTGHRVCHHSDDVCCRGFWDKYKNDFQLGQVAQRLNMVEFVDVDKFTVSGEDASNANPIEG